LGGSIRSFLKIYNKNKMQTSDFLSNAQLLAKLSNKEKIKKYSLASDRADVIDHALQIYSEISNLLKIKNIKSTKWGVSDSIAVKTFHELYSKKITISRS
jgi:exopolyphosphatase/guanosine-5'-triphosphate,3'-diphosphate pyrophosphatase